LETLLPYLSALTALYLGICAWVVYLRRTLGVGLGDGGHKPLKRAIRVHANFAENVPLALLLLVVGADHLSLSTLHGLAATLVVARVLHLVGLGRHPGVSFGRFWGAGLTWGVMGSAAVLPWL
jgi:uncharacterized membrane protein YecN with MAPEG domain